MEQQCALGRRTGELESREAKGRHGECRAEEAEMCQEVRAGEGGEGRQDMDQYTSSQSSDLLCGTEVS